MHEKLDFSNKYDLINEYEEIFFKNGKRIQGKTSEYGGKKSMISKRVYSFNRYLRVMDLGFKSRCANTLRSRLKTKGC